MAGPPFLRHKAACTQCTWGRSREGVLGLLSKKREKICAEGKSRTNSAISHAVQVIKSCKMDKNVKCNTGFTSVKCIAPVQKGRRPKACQCHGHWDVFPFSNLQGPPLRPCVLLCEVQFLSLPEHLRPCDTRTSVILQVCALRHTLCTAFSHSFTRHSSYLGMEEERSRRLAEMSGNAEQHDMARSDRLQRAAAADAARDGVVANTGGVSGAVREGDAFMKAASRDVYGALSGASISDRVNSRKHYVSRG
ncbi:hypothetical protein DUNSADRAFT_18423 [Dunaliella salina]|uniref:Encoded protein n=1 Tax=Dunaliella salina TaxID=3046 RepID=A0ABQ7GZ44_DUNSA|nr:hypothetical protein DUNSADRAFT_18423 [Dunaliella salina]|eukprot:KAF5839880.1 hypothetical protein DUNSADRAFT_18423 [Dunaliella salina]